MYCHVGVPTVNNPAVIMFTGMHVSTDRHKITHKGVLFTSVLYINSNIMVLIQ
jgi:hypothetical protein